MEQTESLKKIHAEAIERFASVEDREKRKKAVEDMRFAHVPGAQWDEDATVKRANRPRLTINRISSAIYQIVGDQRQNRTSIKVRAVSSGADDKTAKIFGGVIRNIESASKATNAYDSAFDEMLTCGYGGWRIITEYNDDDIFEQDILIAPIPSAASSLYFGHSNKYDKRDAPFAFLMSNFTISEFKAKWPDASTSGFSKKMLDERYRCWSNDENIVVAEYWIKEPINKEVGLMSDGRVLDLNDEMIVLDELLAMGVTIVKRRKVKSHKIKRYLMNGLEILEDPMDWAGKYFPLIPSFGKIHTIEGETYVKGLVRDAKDPQRIYNYETSQALETSALSPKDPYWYTPAMASGHEEAWASFPTKNSPFMPFNIDKNMPGPPVRTGAPSVQQASLMMIAQASQDIHATTGLEPASMGNVPELKSGKAIQAQQAMGDRGSFIYTDNLHKSIQYTGEILVDLIPKIIDTPRTIRILNIDGTSELIDVNINQTIMDEETGDKVLINDLTIGKYDVVTDSGPSFMTKRMETADQLIQLMSSVPIFQELIPDLVARNLDINDNEEVTSRLRKRMISQGIVEPTKEEIEELGLNQPQQPDPLQTALLENTQMATQKIMADIENKDADTISKKVNDQQSAAKTLDLLVQTMLDKLKAGVPLTDDEIQLVVAQRDVLAETQDALYKVQ